MNTLSVTIYLPDGTKEEHEVGKSGVTEIYEMEENFPCIVVIQGDCGKAFNNMPFTVKEVIKEGGGRSFT